jgi:putative nucleotidyltransferase with HDIG domain
MPITSTRRTIFLGFLLLVTSGLIFLALVIPSAAPLTTTPLRVGDVAPVDILAPYAHSYESDILTKEQRDQAASQVPAVYSLADTSIGRGQLEHLRTALAYITSVRADSYTSIEQKITDLAALEDIHLSQETATKILSLSDSRWQTVQQEASVVLEQVMRNTIRADQLEEARRSLPALVSLSLPEDQANIAAELAVAFVIPNSLRNEELTDKARQRARDAVIPVTRTYLAGETIVQRGNVITPTNLEALQVFGLVHSPSRWQDLVSALILTLLVGTFFVIYKRRSPALGNDLRGLTLNAILFLAFLFGARLTLPGHVVLPYVYPLMAYGLIVTSLFGPEVALVSSLPLTVLVSYNLPNALELTLYYVISSYFGILTLRRAQRIMSFLWSGVAIAISGAAVTTTFRLLQPTTDAIGLATLAGAAIFNGVASASISVLLQFFLAQFLGLTTALQLIELSRPDHPLLQFLLRNAPGTYQHSLQVANLAEQAAEQIGADPLLTRVGALYHDAGKALNPGFFIENQLPNNVNPHNGLNPIASATTIIRHILDGLEVARKHRLPRRVQDFISEHHGTLITRYQYVKAVENASGNESQVDITKFRYPGPRPQSRETALVMLADGCEACVRAEHPKDEAGLRSIIKTVISERVEKGELNDTNLTLHDLDVIADSFTATLRGVYHPRIIYPTLEIIAPPQEEAAGNESPKVTTDPSLR